jgi:hypothetical protein
LATHLVIHWSRSVSYSGPRMDFPNRYGWGYYLAGHLVPRMDLPRDHGWDYYLVRNSASHSNTRLVFHRGGNNLEWQWVRQLD